MSFSKARSNMVENQVKPANVTNKTLIDIMSSVPREQFVPDSKQEICYIDEDLLIINNRYMMEPIVFARMVQAAEVKKTDIVLDVGCLTGYSTAVLSQMADTVIGLEINDEMVALANNNLSDEKYCNAAVSKGTFQEGLENQGPFDVIFINGAIKGEPELLLKQLKEKGRLVGVEQDESKMGYACLYIKKAGHISKQILFDASIPVLTGFDPKQGFKF